MKKSKIQQLRDVHQVQGADGNWNVAEYMCGMLNGLELALAIMEDRDPEYRDLAKVAEPNIKESK